MPLLKDIVEIKTGYPFRGAIKRVTDGGCRLVQMSDLDGTTSLVRPNLTHIAQPADIQSHALRPNDVLLASRGQRNQAAVFAGPGGDVIPAAHLFVLRSKGGHVIPHFLAWFLNLQQTQNRLHELRRGTSIPFIPLTALELLDVPLPTIQMQKYLSELHSLSIREQELMQQIQTCRRQLIDGVMLTAMQTAPRS